MGHSGRLLVTYEQRQLGAVEWEPVRIERPVRPKDAPAAIERPALPARITTTRRAPVSAGASSLPACDVHEIMPSALATAGGELQRPSNVESP